MGFLGAYDVTKNATSCFYDECGASEKNNKSLTIYDEPDLALSEERAAFVTYAVVDEKVMYEIQWSRECVHDQYNEEKKTYAIQVNDKINKLPDWAIRVIKDDYCNANLDKKIFNLPQFLNREIPGNDSEDKKAMREVFMQPSKNWITVKNYPSLIDDKFKLRDDEEKQPNITPNIPTSPLDKMVNAVDSSDEMQNQQKQQQDELVFKHK